VADGWVVVVAAGAEVVVVVAAVVEVVGAVVGAVAEVVVVVGAVVEVVVESLFGTTGADGVVAGFAVHIA
jgi:hypothetical protein